MEAIRITDEALVQLRSAIAQRMSESRYRHTLAVEEEIAALGAYFLPNRLMELRAAALLHDITKSLSTAEHLALAKRDGIALPTGAPDSPAVLHSLTAEAVIRKEFPALATEEILSAVRRHTVGHPDMSVFDKLLFLADFIEPTRRPTSCRRVREAFYAALARATAQQERLTALDCAVLSAIESTVSYLESEKMPILPETYEVYKAFSKRLDG